MAKRFGLILVSLFLACWIVFLLDLASVVEMAVEGPLGFYPLYGLSAFLGSVAGNLFAFRSRRLTLLERRRLLAICLVLPPGAILLLRSFSPLAERAASPLVPLLALAIYGLFFAVPVSIGRAR